MSLHDLVKCVGCDHPSHNHFNGTGVCSAENYNCGCKWFKSPFAPINQEKRPEFCHTCDPKNTISDYDPMYDKVCYGCGRKNPRLN